MKALVYLFLCVLFLTVISRALSGSDSTSVTSQKNTATAPIEEEELTALEKWKLTEKELKKTVSKHVKSILPQVLKASEHMNISPQCSQSLMKFLTGVRQLKDFAFRMIDASGKIPNGVFGGSINSLGDYDVCINTEVPGHFQGQYCTLDVKPPLPPRKRFVSYDIPLPEFTNATSKDSVLHMVMEKGRFYYHVNFRSSLCVPSTCSKEEVQDISRKVLNMTGMKFEVVIPNCEVKVDKIILDKTEIGVLTVLCITVFIAIAATGYDVIMNLTSEKIPIQKNRSLPLRCLHCFSFYTNFKKLMKNDDNPESIKIFHGMKTITMLWIILGHTYYYQNYQAMNNLLEVREKGKEYLFQLISNAMPSVETFFFISAVLVSYSIIKIKGRKLNIFLFAFRRLWRLTPPLMYIIGITILLPHLGSGPVWKETVVDRLTEKCRKNWWINLSYFTNFLLLNEMCLDWTWYIPVDTHLYFLSLIVLIPLKKNHRVGLIINAVLFLTGIVTSAAFHVYYHLPPLIIFVYMHPDDYSYLANRGYHRTYLHIATYSIGLYTGYLLATNKKFKISKMINVLGWMMALTMGLGVTIGIYDWNNGHLPGMFVSPLFGSTNRAIFALGLAYVTLACMTGYGGIVTKILSWNGFVPLGRLSYMTYLVHPLIHFGYLGSARAPIIAEHRTLIHQYCGTVVIAYLAALFASLLFETPFMALEKVFLSSQKPNGIPEKQDENENSKLELSIFQNGHSQKNENGVYVVNFKSVGLES